MKKIALIIFFGLVSIVSQAQPFPSLRVVTSHAVLADVAKFVGVDAVSVTSLVAWGDDARNYTLTADDIQTVADADILLLNGAGYEPFAQDLINSVDTPYWIISEGMNMIGTRRGELLVDNAEASLYMQIENLSNQDVSLITAEATWFTGAMTHSTQMSGNMAQMQDMNDGIMIPANSSVMLEPASLHLMAMGIQDNLVEGNTYNVTLRFSDGSELLVPLTVTVEGISAGTTISVSNDRVRVTNAWTYPLQVRADPPTNEGAYLGALLDDVNCGDNPSDTVNLADCNPFVWYDPQNVMDWTRQIALIFSEYHPDNTFNYQNNSQALISLINALDSDIRTQLDSIPLDQRVISVNDERLAYFATRYGITLQKGQISASDFAWTHTSSDENYLEWMRQNVDALIAYWTGESVDNTQVIDPILQANLDTLASTAENLRELELTAKISLHFPTRDELKVYLDEQLDIALTPEAIAESTRFYVAFGFLSPDVDLRALYDNFYNNQVGGFYDSESKAMNVVLLAQNAQLGDNLPLLERVVFVHEYTHALQDQYFDLTAYLQDEQAQSNGDRYIARLALVEGDATAVMNIYLALEAQTNPLGTVFSALYGGLQAGNLTLPEGTPQIIADELLFPYNGGATFVQALYRSSDSWQAVNDAYKNPPASSEHILHPEKYFANEQPQTITLDDHSQVLGANWTLGNAGVLGEFYLSRFLATHLPDSVATTASAGWGGDAYHIYTNVAGEWALVLDLAWDSTTDNDEFVMAIADYAQARFGTSVNETGCYISDAHTLCMGSGKLTIAPTSALALALITE
jgi:ABC-type Zn uptake system ZnuABC Zn-binding protein ZnuA